MNNRKRKNVGLGRMIMFYAIAATSIGSPALASITHLNTFGGSGTDDGKFSVGNGIAGIDTASNGHVYIVDPGFDATSGSRIQVFDREGNFLFKWGSFGTSDGKFAVPSGLAINSDDEVYVTDQFNHRIQKFTSAGVHLKNFDGTATGGPGFDIPVGITVGADDQVYVVDTSDISEGTTTELIHRFNSAEMFQNTWGGAAFTISERGDGEFFRAYSAAADPISGQVYVTDTGNSIPPAERFQVFSSTGTFIDKVDTLGNGDGEIIKPFGVGVNALGTLYVTDASRGDVQKFDADLNYIDKFGSFGTDDGQFFAPTAVTAAPTGEVYVVDFRARVQRFFDSEAWASGTNTFDDAVAGAGELLGPGQNLSEGKHLIVPGSTTVGAGATLSLSGGSLETGTLDLTPGGTFIMTGGRLAADVVMGDLDVQGGTVAPGNSPGTTSVNGTYTQRSDVSLEIEITSPGITAGTHYDELNVTGSATLNGTLVIELDAGFIPALGSTFSNVMTFASHSGTFDQLEGALISTDLAIAPLFAASGDALNLRASIPGDVNLDNHVTVADLSTFALNFGTSPGVGSWTLGDFNGDGTITVADLSLLALNFGFDPDATSPPPGLSLDAIATLAGIDPAEIPEPGTLSLIGLMSGLLASRRVRHKRLAG